MSSAGFQRPSAVGRSDRRTRGWWLNGQRQSILSAMLEVGSAGRLRRRRILIVKPSSLGDIVHALPVLAAMRRTYPRAWIAWLVSSTFAPLLEGHPLLDEVIRFDRRRFGRMLQSPPVLADFLRFVWHLRRRRFDLVVDLQGLLRSGFLAWTSGAAQRVGFAHARELAAVFYSRRVSCPPRVRHAVDRNLCVARALGLSLPQVAARGREADRRRSRPAPTDPERFCPAQPSRSPADDCWPDMFPLGLRPSELDAAGARLAGAAGRPLERFIALLPGARWESKRWPAEYWAGLVAALHAAGLPSCVLLGSGDDRTLADRVQRDCGCPVVDLVGRTSLRELAAIIALSSLVVCQDSGPMHLAAALGRPLVALFGPTSPDRTGPYPRPAWCPTADRREPRQCAPDGWSTAAVLSLRLPCAPCHRRRCPHQHHACMRGLTVERVLKQVRQLCEI